MLHLITNSRCAPFYVIYGQTAGMVVSFPVAENLRCHTLILKRSYFMLLVLVLANLLVRTMKKQKKVLLLSLIFGIAQISL